MTRTPKVLWIAIALLAVAVWLVDPLGWRARRSNGEAAARGEDAPLALDESTGPDLHGAPHPP